MKIVNVKAVQIIGTCPAGLTTEDQFQIAEMNLENPLGSNICFLAMSQISIGQGIWELQADERFFSHVSCPGCTIRLDEENRVVFLLGQAYLWKLCQIISEYIRLCKQYQEPETAQSLKELSIRYQSQGDYQSATGKMEAALRELKQSISNMNITTANQS